MSNERRKRVLIVTETGDAWPSGYTRALIYKDLFKSDGIECEYVSRQVPYLVRWVEKSVRVSNGLLGRGLAHALRYLNRWLGPIRERAIIRKAASDYDVVYLQKLGSWRLVSELRRTCRSRLIYDLNDAVWLPSCAGFAEGRITDILRLVDSVTCDNPLGLEFARSHNDSVFLVPDPPQVELFDQYRSSIQKESSPLVLGWIGSPSTLFNLFAIWEALEVLFERFGNITLRLIGTGRDQLLLPRFEKVRYTTLPFYSQADMLREVLQMDIGLFPMFDVEDSRVRGILKATVYMSGEACVVTSPIGQNCDLIQDGNNGMLARDTKEWVDKISALVEDAALRQRLGRAGLATVREKFTVKQCYEELRRSLFGES